MVAVGCEFAFLINFSTSKHANLYSAPGTAELYSKTLATQLESCRDIAMLLVWEQHCWHCELINSRCHYPRIYTEGNIIFTRHAMRSDAKQGCVDKLMHPFTGPWWIFKSLRGASYKIECINTSRWDKKHASDLLPYPPKLIPFQPADTADNQYGQLYLPICKSPYKEAGIKGFKPLQPFCIASHFLTTGDFCDFHFPMLAKLNNEFCPFPRIDDEERQRVMSRDDFEEADILYHGMPPLLATPSPPAKPILTHLVSSILASSERLLFILHLLGNPTTHEWCLVQVSFANSTALSPLCLQDG
jgi:hypothetical protein